MVIIELATGQELAVVVSPVEGKDYKHISRKRYFFDWKKERGIADMFKLMAAGNCIWMVPGYTHWLTNT